MTPYYTRVCAQVSKTQHRRMNVPGHPNTRQSLVQYNLAVLVLAVEISSKTDHASVLLLQPEEIFLVCNRCEQLIWVLKKLVFLIFFYFGFAIFFKLNLTHVLYFRIRCKSLKEAGGQPRTVYSTTFRNPSMGFGCGQPAGKYLWSIRFHVICKKLPRFARPASRYLIQNDGNPAAPLFWCKPSKVCAVRHLAVHASVQAPRAPSRCPAGIPWMPYLSAEVGSCVALPADCHAGPAGRSSGIRRFWCQGFKRPARHLQLTCQDV